MHLIAWRIDPVIPARESVRVPSRSKSTARSLMGSIVPQHGPMAVRRLSTHLQERTLPEIVRSPALEDEQSPEGPGMVARAALVLRDEAADRDRVEYPAGAEAGFGEEPVQDGREGATQPRGHGHSEALLAPARDLGGQPIGHGPAEQPLQASKALELQLGRDAAQQLDERVVEQRRAELEARGH